jgi:signal transduction histidine kinase
VAIVLGDRHRLRQLLLNLTDNAIKYNRPDGTVAISLRHAGNFAELKIENTDVRIAPELQSRVFERFFRGDPSHGNTVEGCGLGLSIAQWITTAHGGSIKFLSEKNKLPWLSLCPVKILGKIRILEKRHLHDGLTVIVF